MHCCILNMYMDKAEKYRLLERQAALIVEDSPDEVATMANVASLIHSEFGFWWTGFYRVRGNELILGPFQGTVACTVIPFGKGVCGTAWKNRKTIVVPDVEKFPGHIACSSESRSEIVVPIFRNDEITAVLDIDSREYAAFNEVDACALERIVAML